mmetsp:Transcript_4759/g.19045  ORF Transcript_4759/g.19045 Transcript_4759/m.19045 type:complete len:80 (-) Transcript_4759:1008-1247(-)
MALARPRPTRGQIELLKGCRSCKASLEPVVAAAPQPGESLEPSYDLTTQSSLARGAELQRWREIRSVKAAFCAARTSIL